MNKVNFNDQRLWTEMLVQTVQTPIKLLIKHSNHQKVKHSDCSEYPLIEIFTVRILD